MVNYHITFWIFKTIIYTSYIKIILYLQLFIVIDKAIKKKYTIYGDTMNIGIDIDDTIVNTSDYIIKYADIYNKKISGSSIRKNIGNIHSKYYLSEMYDWNDEIKKDFFNYYYENIISECSVLPYVKESLIKLKNDGHKLVYITARTTSIENCNTYDITKDMFLKNKIPYDKLLLNSWDKLQIAKENNIDIMIDDCYDTCVEFNRNGIKAILMTSKINSNIIELDIVKRVKNWKELYKMILEEKCERI